MNDTLRKQWKKVVSEAIKDLNSDAPFENSKVIADVAKAIDRLEKELAVAYHKSDITDSSLSKMLGKLTSYQDLTGEISNDKAI